MSETAAPAELLQVAARLRLAVTRLNRRLRAEGEFGDLGPAVAIAHQPGQCGTSGIGGQILTDQPERLTGGGPQCRHDRRGRRTIAGMQPFGLLL